MATVVNPDASAKQSQKSAPLSAFTKVAQAALFISAAVQLVLGAFIWTGQADELIPIHIAVGILLVLSLWTIAAIAVRSGVSLGLVVGAIAFSLVAPILGLTQEGLLEGDWHWTIQVVHVLIGIGVVACGRVLVVSMENAYRTGATGVSN